MCNNVEMSCDWVEDDPQLVPRCNAAAGCQIPASWEHLPRFSRGSLAKDGLKEDFFCNAVSKASQFYGAVMSLLCCCESVLWWLSSQNNVKKNKSKIFEFDFISFLRSLMTYAIFGLSAHTQTKERENIQ